jgi:hypothetical protein
LLHYGLIQKYETRLVRLARDKHSSLFGLFFADALGKQAEVFIPSKPFKPSLLFVGKAKHLPHRETPETCSRWAGGSITRSGWRGLPRTSTLTARMFVSVV